MIHLFRQSLPIAGRLLAEQLMTLARVAHKAILDSVVPSRVIQPQVHRFKTPVPISANVAVSISWNSVLLVQFMNSLVNSLPTNSSIQVPLHSHMCPWAATGELIIDAQEGLIHI